MSKKTTSTIVFAALMGVLFLSPSSVYAGGASAGSVSSVAAPAAVVSKAAVVASVSADDRDGGDFLVIIQIRILRKLLAASYTLSLFGESVDPNAVPQAAGIAANLTTLATLASR